MKSIWRKKRMKIMTVMLLIMNLIFSSPVLTKAEEKYMQGESVDFTILLDENGDAQIREIWNCYFGGDTITRYRRKFKLPEDEYTIQMESIQMDGEEMELLDEPDEERPEGCAAVYEEDDVLNLEMYLDALEESHEFTFEYQVSDAVVLHDDVAEFRWQIISDKEAFDIENISGEIYLPYEISENDIFFWGHGPEEDTWFGSAYQDEMTDEFSMEVPYAPVGTRVSVRFAMPLELFENGSRYEPGEALEQIITEEEEYEQASTQNTETDMETDMEEEEMEEVPISSWERFLYRYEDTLVNISTVFLFVPPILLATIAGPLARGAGKRYRKKMLRKLQTKPQNIPQYYSQVPDDMKPAMVYKLMTFYEEDGKYVRENGNLVASVLADLIERGVIWYQYQNGETYLQVVCEQSALDSGVFSDYEKAILELLLQAGDRGPVSISDMNRYAEDNTSCIHDIRTRIRQSVNDEFDALGITQKLPGKKMSRWAFILSGLLLTAIISIGIGIELGIAAVLIGLPFAFLDIGMLGQAIKTSFPAINYLNPEGEMRYDMWKAFSNYLDYIPEMKEEELSGLKRWRRELVYAVALGRGEKVSRQLNMDIESRNVKIEDRNTSFRDDHMRTENQYEDMEDDSYAYNYGNMFLWFDAMDKEIGYKAYVPQADNDYDTDDSGSSWDSYDGGDGGFSDSGGDYDSGSDGSDFD